MTFNGFKNNAVLAHESESYELSQGVRLESAVSLHNNTSLATSPSSLSPRARRFS